MSVIRIFNRQRYHIRNFLKISYNFSNASKEIENYKAYFNKYEIEINQIANDILIINKKILKQYCN